MKNANPKVTMGEVLREVRRKWTAMGAAEKLEYNKKASLVIE